MAFNFFEPPLIYGTVVVLMIAVCLLMALFKLVSQSLAERTQDVAPEFAGKRLLPEDYEALCCRTGFNKAELSRIYARFMQITGGESYCEVDKVIDEMPYFDGPLKSRFRYALHLPDQVDFVLLASALSVFCERTALDEKMRFLFHLYNVDESATVSKKDLVDLLYQILPDTQDELEKEQLINRAVDGTFEELCGSSEQQELGVDQFVMAATPIIGERCTIFF
mmetsp:Transcript_22715/g.41126  ORF Transcript_22715/g.41126 Transcript_22715/m.41126 type:complete len:223 (-) Transcript_22715:45-713(-)